MFAEQFLGGITPDSIEAFFKGTGILGAVGVLLYLVIRYKVVRLVSVDSASEWIRAKWGVEQYRHFGKRHGRLVRLKAGRHLIIRGMYDGWEVCMREIPLVIKGITQPFRGRMLQFDQLTISYQVIAPDTLEGDKTMLLSFLSVRNLDRDNQKSESLDDKVLSITLAGLGRHLKNAEADEYGLPRLSQKRLIRLVERPLRKKHGVRIVGIMWSEPTWLMGQQQFDAGRMIARALNPSLTGELEGEKAPVYDLPTPAQLA